VKLAIATIIVTIVLLLPVSILVEIKARRLPPRRSCAAAACRSTRQASDMTSTRSEPTR